MAPAFQCEHGATHGADIDELEALKQLLQLVVTRLGSPEAEERYDALDELAELLDGAFGEDGEVVGRIVRGGGGVRQLALLIMETDREVAMQAMCCLGNLCSDTVDTASCETKAALLEEEGSAEALLRYVSVEEGDMAVLACGALQNLCSTAAWSKRAVQELALPRLEALLEADEPRLRRYAAGALKNIIQAAHTDVSTGGCESDWADVWLSENSLRAVERRAFESALEQFMFRRAVRVVKAAAAAMDVEVRTFRMQRWQPPESDDDPDEGETESDASSRPSSSSVSLPPPPGLRSSFGSEPEDTFVERGGHTDELTAAGVVGRSRLVASAWRDRVGDLQPGTQVVVEPGGASIPFSLDAAYGSFLALVVGPGKKAAASGEQCYTVRDRKGRSQATPRSSLRVRRLHVEASRVGAADMHTIDVVVGAQTNLRTGAMRSVRLVGGSLAEGSARVGSAAEAEGGDRSASSAPAGGPGPEVKPHRAPPPLPCWEWLSEDGGWVAYPPHVCERLRRLKRITIELDRHGRPVGPETTAQAAAEAAAEAEAARRQELATAEAQREADDATRALLGGGEEGKGVSQVEARLAAERLAAKAVAERAAAKAAAERALKKASLAREAARLSARRAEAAKAQGGASPSRNDAPPHKDSSPQADCASPAAAPAAASHAAAPAAAETHHPRGSVSMWLPDASTTAGEAAKRLSPSRLRKGDGQLGGAEEDASAADAGGREDAGRGVGAKDAPRGEG